MVEVEARPVRLDAIKRTHDLNGERGITNITCISVNLNMRDNRDVGSCRPCVKFLRLYIACVDVKMRKKNYHIFAASVTVCSIGNKNIVCSYRYYRPFLLK